VGKHVLRTESRGGCFVVARWLEDARDRRYQEWQPYARIGSSENNDGRRRKSALAANFWEVKARQASPGKVELGSTSYVGGKALGPDGTRARR